MADLHCMQCGSVLVRGVCRECGYGSKTQAAGGDIDHLRCAWNAEGERCRFAGGISSDTHGHGPWYCGRHFGCSDPILGAEIVAQSVQAHPDVPDYSAGGVLARVRAEYRKALPHAVRIDPATVIKQVRSFALKSMSDRAPNDGELID